MFGLVKRIWTSPAAMTAGSVAARLSSVVLVLPLIVTRLSAEEIALWYLFGSVVTLLVLVDLGFTPTFVRAIGYASAGASVAELNNGKRALGDTGAKSPNDETMCSILATMRPIFIGIAILSFVGVATLGTLSIWALAEAVPDSRTAWLAWICVVTTAPIGVFANYYGAYLQGVNAVAVYRRWEMLFALAAVGSNAMVLALGGGLLALALSNQSWILVTLLRNRWLFGRMGGYGRPEGGLDRFSVSVMRAVWPAAWRSGVGVLMSLGLLQLTAIIYAQMAPAKEAASYLLALRFVSVVSQFSQAPFYSKIPMFVQMHARNDVQGKRQLAVRGMALAYWLFVIGIIGVGIVIDPLLAFIGSNVEFVSPAVWALLGLAMFVERYGAMHIQLYSTTNHIIWHIANTGSGVLSAVAICALYPTLGLIALPLSLLIGYVGFYAWYSAWHSYRELGSGFGQFEIRTSALPLAAMLAYGATSMMSIAR